MLDARSSKSHGSFDNSILPSTSGTSSSSRQHTEGQVETATTSHSSDDTPRSAPKRDALEEFTDIVERARIDEPGLRIWDCTDILAPDQLEWSDGRQRTDVNEDEDGLAADGVIGTVAASSRNDTARRTARYALIILNQPIPARKVFDAVWSSSLHRICADGGANRLYDALSLSEREEYKPDLIKGDLDSLRADVRDYYQARGVRIVQDKDEYSTDLMKCIEEIDDMERKNAGRRGDQDDIASGQEGGEGHGDITRIPIILLGGLSGRVDQTVHTMALLHKLCTKRPEVFVVSDDSLAWTLDEGSHLIRIDHQTMSQTCGILPVGIESAVVTTRGLKWDIDEETSFRGLISTSNHLLPSEPVVYLRTTRPVLWCVEIRH